MQNNFTSRGRGLSLLELLVTISIIGVLAAGVSMINANVHEKARIAKLQTDVKTINSAIHQFIANGGNFTGAKSPQEIIDRMKTQLAVDKQSQFVGFTGSTIDNRLSARISDQSRGKLVAVWNEVGCCFGLSNSSDLGATEFFLDDLLAEKDYGTEGRTLSIVGYNDKPGWIWKFADGVADAKAPVTDVGTSGMPDTAPPALPQKLLRPVPSKYGGGFPADSYPMDLSFTNPNDPLTMIMYSVDGGSFIQYTGTLTLNGAARVEAYVTGDPGKWIDSERTVLIFSAYDPPPPRLLAPPLINLSSARFDDTTSEISVSISDRNSATESSLFYSIIAIDGVHGAKDTWLPYGGAFQASVDDYPDGFEVASYAKSKDTRYYTDSETAAARTGATFYDTAVVGNILFVIDASSSMGASFGSVSKFDATIEELKAAIANLPSGIKFSAAFFDEGIHWTDGSFKLRPSNLLFKAAMIHEVDRLDYDSGTNYEVALSLPVMFDPIPDQVVLLTDGEPSNNGYLDDLATLVDLGIRVDTIGMNVDSAGRAVLQNIADVSGGGYREVGEDDYDDDDDDDDDD